MATNYNDSKTGAKYSVGQSLRIYDEDYKKFVNGEVEEVGEETISIKWEDLTEPTEYRIDSVTLKGDLFSE